MRIDGAQEGFRQAMAWLHTWVGLLLGWLLFAVFLTGSLSFFKQEFNLWSRPELQTLGPAAPLDAAQLARIEQRMQELAPQVQGWRLSLPDERRPAYSLSWRAPPPAAGQRPRFEQRSLDPATLQPVNVRSTFGVGEFFYRFHFELRSAPQSRWILEGRWVVGLATLLMLVALLSGIVTHRRFFKDFFTFRPRAKAAQRSWLDAHNVSGVLVLPFYLLMTFSGLMTLHSLYMPAGIGAAYGSKSGDYFRELAGDPPPGASTGRNAEGQVLPVLGEAGWAPLLAQARAHWPGGRIDSVSLQLEGGQARVEFGRHEGDRLQYRGPRLQFDVASGRLLQAGDNAAPAARTYGVLYGLHIARFAGWPLRWLLFGFGLLGSAMIATGLVLWCVKRQADAERRRQPTGRGHRLVRTLNIAAIAGLPLAIACLLYANRLLPLDLGPQRGAAELQCFFAGWGLALLYAAWRPERRGWSHLFALAAALFAVLPLLDLALFGRLGLPALQAGWLGAAALLAWLSRLTWRVQAHKPARPAPAAVAEGC